MGDGVIPMPSIIHDIKIVHTEVTVSGSLTAYNGGVVQVTPTPPDGYKLLTHIATWNTDIAGLIAVFDTGAGARDSATVNVYQFNARNSSISSRGRVHLLSAYYR